VTASVSGWRDRLRGDVGFRLAIAFAVLVHVPALFAPFIIDDFAQREMTQGLYAPGDRGPFALYDFIDDSNRAALLERGVFPWWTHPHLVVRFLRPLSSFSLYLDYRIAPRLAWWGHLHSLLWWAAATLLVYAILESSFTRRIARIGSIVFALAQCHVIPLLWIANREAIISTATGAAGLLLYLRWRRERRARDAIATFAAFCLAMAAGEYSLCFSGYVVAFEVLRRRESFLARASGLAPFVVPAAAYLGLRSALQYGARGGGMYFDPFWNFGAFLADAPRRFSVLMCAAWAGVDDEMLLAQRWWVVMGVAVAAAALLTVVVAQTFRSVEEPVRREASWLLGGSVLAVVPVLAVHTSARLLGAAMIGVSAVVAVVLDRAWFPERAQPRRGMAELTATLALGLAFIHFVRAPIAGLAETQFRSGIGDAIERRMAWVRERAAGRSAIVVLRAEAFATALFAPCMLDDVTLPWRVLSYEAGRVLVVRSGDRSLELIASPRPIFQMGADEVFRGMDGSLHAGDSVQLTGMKATVLQLDKDGMPKRARFDFDKNLSDPSILWLRETAAGFEEQSLPQRGQGEPIVP